MMSLSCQLEPEMMGKGNGIWMVLVTWLGTCPYHGVKPSSIIDCDEQDIVDKEKDGREMIVPLGEGFGSK